MYEKSNMYNNNCICLESRYSRKSKIIMITISVWRHDVREKSNMFYNNNIGLTSRCTRKSNTFYNNSICLTVKKSNTLIRRHSKNNIFTITILIGRHDIWAEATYAWKQKCFTSRCSSKSHFCTVIMTIIGLTSRCITKTYKISLKSYKRQECS